MKLTKLDIFLVKVQLEKIAKGSNLEKAKVAKKLLSDGRLLYSYTERVLEERKQQHKHCA